MIDGAILWDDETAYFFRGPLFYRFDIGPDVVPAGYPRAIAGEWARWPSDWVDVDAGVVWPNGKIYFFRRQEYLAFDLAADSVAPGYPAPTKPNWKGWPEHWTRVDGALVWPNGRAYFFCSNEYLAFDIASDTVLPGYPQPIASGWRGWPSDWTNIDSAILWPNGRAYFFRGDEYLAFDIEKDTVLPGYPATIESGWNGLPRQ